MNQILSTDIPKQPDKSKIDEITKQAKKIEKRNKKVKKELTPQAIQIVGIIRAFAIFLLIFGVFNIAFGGYSFAKLNEEKDKLTEIPSIEISDIDITDDKLEIIVKCKNPINKLTYWWNDEQQSVISGNNIASRTETIEVPNGQNILHVQAESSDGKIKTIEQVIFRDGNISIEFSNQADNAIVNITSKTEIDYITYRWNDEAEVRQDYTSGETEEKLEIEIPYGKNKLTVVVVDKAHEQEYADAEYNGTTDYEDKGLGPNLEITKDGNNFKIYATSDEGIRQVYYYITNDFEYQDGKVFVDKKNGEDTYEYKFPMYSGNNKLTIKIFDVNNNVSIKTAEYYIDEE